VVRSLPLLIVVAALLSVPRPVSAQKDAFVDGLVALTEALSGTYGDEGAQARAALDTMARAVSVWDRFLREAEETVASRLPTATSEAALEMRTTMGVLYLERGRLRDALREFEAAGRIAPQRPAFHLFQALVHEAANDPAAALQAFRRAWELEPDDPVKAYLLSERLFEAGRTEEALRPAGALRAAAGLIAADKFQARETPFIRASLVQDEASSTPLFGPAAYQPAYALIERSAYPEAIAALRAAAAADPLVAGGSTPRLAEGAAALRDGRIADARRHFAAEVAERPRSSEAHRMIAVAYWAAAEYEPSIEHLEQAMALAPADERARVTLASVLTEAGQLARAERTLAEAVQALPSSAVAHWRLGRLYASTRRPQEAVRALEQAAGLSALAGRARLYAEIGALHLRLLDPDAAVQAFSRAVRLAPNSESAHRERGRALLLGGRHDEAFGEFVAALLVSPADPEACVAIGQIHLAAGRYADAVLALERAVALKPDAAEARYALGTALVRMGRQEAGATHLEEFHRLQTLAVEEERRRIEISVWKIEAGVLARDGAYERAATLWRAIVAAQPGVASNHADLAASLARTGQLDAAVDQYEQAIGLGADAGVYRQLAALYEKMGRPDESVRTRARLQQRRQESLRRDPAAR
jgi:tetratricopeptide (TPR) repeat protein